MKGAKVDFFMSELMILNCIIKTRMITRMDGAGGQVIDGGQSFDL